MNVALHKDNRSTVKDLKKEQQIQLENLMLSYEDIKDNKVLAMLFGHKINELQVVISQTDTPDAVLALMLAAEHVSIIDIETCDSSLDILSKMYPEKAGQFRRAKMLGKNLMGVI